MSSFNPIVRRIDPNKAETNGRFLRNYLNRTNKDVEDERVADPDATAGSLIRWLLGSAFPRTHTLDCAIRVSSPDHAALPALVIRHFIQFTLVYLLCLVMKAIYPALALKIECACVVAIFALAGLLRLAADDTTLFFQRIAETFCFLALVAIVLVSAPADFIEVFIAIVMTIALAAMLTFPFVLNVNELTTCGIRLLLVIVLVYAFPRAGTTLSLPPVAAAALFLTSNFFALLPIPAGMQHWYAAHPHADLEDVRNYGPTAPLYWGNWRAALAGLLAYVAATLTALLLAVQFVRFGLPLYSTSTDVQPDFHSLTYLLGATEAAAFLNFSLFAIIVQHRLPSIGRFLASYYSTWRALAAWLSNNPSFRYPTIFQFVRPWSSRSVRIAIVIFALAANSAFTVNWLTTWTLQAYRATFPSAVEAQAPATVPVPNAGKTTHFGTQYWVTLFTAALLLPPAILFITLHATWGPSFQAFNDRFETFDRRVTPPLLAISLGATLRRSFAVIVSATTFL